MQKHVYTDSLDFGLRATAHVIKLKVGNSFFFFFISFRRSMTYNIRHPKKKLIKTAIIS